MQFALTCVVSGRGHDVTLYEKSPVIGGQFNMAKVIVYFLCCVRLRVGMFHESIVQ